MFDALLTLPTWLVTLIAAGLAGLVGLSIAVPLRRTRPGIARYLPLAFVAIGYAATDRLVVPWLTDSDTALCALANEEAQRPGPPPAGTSFDGAGVDCAAKTFTLSYTAPANATIDPAGQANARAAFTADTCGNPNRRRLVEAGWAVEQAFLLGTRRTVVLEARC